MKTHTYQSAKQRQKGSNTKSLLGENKENRHYREPCLIIVFETKLTRKINWVVLFESYCFFKVGFYFQGKTETDMSFQEGNGYCRFL